MSHPTWVRGLKLQSRLMFLLWVCVAPYMGAWIEISTMHHCSHERHVAPYMGAWIEIELGKGENWTIVVAPYMGAWIEILLVRALCRSNFRRTLHGCVD